MRGTVAVVIPAFNEEKAITQTLESLYEQKSIDFCCYVVDNGSTDNTQQRIYEFAEEHDDFPLTLVEEGRKGTGHASNTGFMHAQEHGHTVIARTDADTSPGCNWIGRIQRNFEDPSLRLLSGVTSARRDEYYRRSDSVLCPAGSMAARVLYAVKWRSLGGFKHANGANLATTASAFNNLGGFSPTKIEDENEDILYSADLLEFYGSESMRFDPRMIVFTSMRRIREIGYLKTPLYWGSSKLDADQKARLSGGEIDVR